MNLIKFDNIFNTSEKCQMSFMMCRRKKICFQTLRYKCLTTDVCMCWNSSVSG